ncbi:MAG: hypothetical protein CR986_01055 [Ignavibacteriae bacterium]|nr:MAG: hypothetical protein CR986_01055 [Ignavibacteriota bacterium]
MRKNNKEYAELRKAALKQLQEEVSLSSLSEDKIKEKLHELSVHQIELEIQNNELRNAKLEIELRKEEYEKLFNKAPFGYMLLDSNGMILKANYFIQNLFNEAATAIIDKPFVTFLEGEDKKLFLGIFPSFFKNPGKKNYKFKIKDKIIQITGKHQKNTKGIVTALLLNVIDVTERELMTRQIAADKELYSSIINSALEGFLLINYKGLILDINQSASQMLGYLKDELIGANIKTIESDENCETLLSLFIKPESETRITYLTKHLRKDKFLINVEVSTSVINKEYNKFVIIFTKDITNKLCNQKIHEKRIELLEYSATTQIPGVLLKALEICAEITESEIALWYECDNKSEKAKLLQYFPNKTTNNLLGDNKDYYDCINLNNKFNFKNIYLNNNLNEVSFYNTPVNKFEVNRQIIVPIIRNSSTAGFIVVANKSKNYVNEDVQIMEDFSNIAWNIYERLQTKENLFKSELTKSTIVDVLPDLMLEINKKGSIINYFKGKHTELFISENKLKNSNITAIFPPNVINLAKKKILDALLQNCTTNFEYSHSYKTKFQHFSVRIVKFTDSSVLCFLRDETDKEIAKSIIIESEEKFAKAFYKSPLLKSINNLNTDQFIEVNKKFTEVTGYKKSEVLGKTQVNLGIISKETYNKIFEELLNTGSIYNLQIEMIKADGKKIIANYNGQIISLAGKKHLLSWYEDITKKLKNEKEIKEHRINLEKLVEERTEELSETNKKLEVKIRKTKETEEAAKSALEKSEELVKLKSQFMSLASKEFRTPLTTILTASQSIDNYLKKDDKINIARNSKKIQDSVHNLISILGEIIVLSKTDKAKIGIDYQNVNIKELVENIITNISYQKKLNQNIIVENNLTQFEVLADPKILNHILTNLLINGINYSYDNSTIKLKLNNSEDKLILKVSDNGPGISKEDIHRIFEAFYRGNNGTNIQGSGLGLSVVKKYVEIYKGNIAVNSDNKSGTEFTVTIPFNKAKI